MELETGRIRIKDIARKANVSTGTVDRVIHKRMGVSQKSKEKVQKILDEMHYVPNRYASALALNKKFLFICLIPLHHEDEYWQYVENGIVEAIQFYSDFNIKLQINYYDPFNPDTFKEQSKKIIKENPSGIIFSPTSLEATKEFTDILKENEIPFVYLDSFYKEIQPLAFFGQHSFKSGYFAGKLLMSIGSYPKEIAIFRNSRKGIIGSNQQEVREIGFRNYMQSTHPKCKILTLDLKGENNIDDIKAIKEFSSQHLNLERGITFNSKAFLVAENFRSINNNKFIFIGYDLLKRNREALKKGHITMLIAQRPEQQGSYAVKALSDHLLFKKDFPWLHYMPFDLITKETLEFYNF